jgi:hypothetical protein
MELTTIHRYHPKASHPVVSIDSLVDFFLLWANAVEWSAILQMLFELFLVTCDFAMD